MLRWLINNFRSSLLTQVNGELNRTLWPSQIYQIIASQQQCPLTTAGAEQLLGELEHYFQHDKVTRAPLAADVKVLCFFVTLRFSRDPITPATLTCLFDEKPTVSKERYKMLVQQLLATEVKEWQAFFSEPKQVNLSLLRERLEMIQRLRYLEYPLMRDTRLKPTLPPLDNQESHFGHWLYRLLSTCWQQLNRILQQWVFGHTINNLLRHQSSDYLAVADNVLQLMRPFNDQLESNQQANLSQILHQWYTQGADFWAKQPYFFDSALAHFPNSKHSWKNEFQLVQQSLQSDREQLSQWLEFAFKGALMLLQVDEAQGINSYLLIYQQLQNKIRDFNVAAWAYRSRCEEQLQTLFRGNQEERLLYLSRLQTLDDRLHRQFSKFTGIVWDGFSSLSYVDESPVIEDIKRYLVYLDSELQYLSSLTHWLHHSCYCCDATEGALTYEMNQHLRAANYSSKIRYQDRATVLILTDHVVQCLGPKAWDKMIRTHLHPDKHPSYLAPIANFGFKQIQSLQKQAKQLVSRWQQGQWASSVHRDTPRLTAPESLSTTANQESALAPLEKPSTALDLSVLDLKAEYIQKLKAKANLTKYPSEPSGDSKYPLYEGQDNEQERALWRLQQESRYVRRKQEKELAEIRRETAVHNQKAEKYEKEAEQHRREREEINRNTEQYRQEKENAWQKLQRVADARLTTELILTLEQQRPTNAEGVQILFNTVIIAVQTKSEHETTRIAVSDWQESDFNTAFLRIIRDRDDLHDLAHLLWRSQQAAKVTNLTPSSEARHQHRLFTEPTPFSNDNNNSLPIPHH